MVTDESLPISVGSQFVSKNRGSLDTGVLGVAFSRESRCRPDILMLACSYLPLNKPPRETRAVRASMLRPPTSPKQVQRMVRTHRDARKRLSRILRYGQEFRWLHTFRYR